TLPSHGLTSGQAVLYTRVSGRSLTDSNGISLTNNRIYYVIVVDQNTIRLAASYLNANPPNLGQPTPVDLVRPADPAPGGTPNRYQLVALSESADFKFIDKTVTVAANTIVKTGAFLPFTTGQPVLYQNTGGSGIGLNDNQVYYVISRPDGTLQLAKTLADALSAPPKNVPLAWTGLTDNFLAFPLPAHAYP